MSTYGSDVADEIMSIMLGGTDGETVTAYMLSEMTGWSLREVWLALDILRVTGQAVKVNPDANFGTPFEWRATRTS